MTHASSPAGAAGPRLLLAGLPLLLLALPQDAEARRVPLDPQNRLHVGLSIADFGTMGIGGGLDSRLTRVISVDAGGYLSPGAPSGDLPTSDPADDPHEWFSLRHSLYVTPGFRVPHRYKGQLTWDLYGRVGFGVVWADDAAATDDVILINPAFIGGGELLLRKDSVGLRFTGKANHFRAYSTSAKDEIALTRPQWGAEVVYQW